MFEDGKFGTVPCAEDRWKSRLIEFFIQGDYSV